MAYVNVHGWRSEQVAQWLRGLDDSIYPYCHYFVNNNVTGQQLLNLTVSDLIKLHVEKLGHQEIILEGLEKLRNLVSIPLLPKVLCSNRSTSIPAFAFRHRKPSIFGIKIKLQGEIIVQ